MLTRIALVQCVKRKHETSAPARKLYVSALFRGLQRYAEINADDWFILSAEHGLLHPEQIIEPYERTLNEMPKHERIAWAERVNKQLLEVLPTGAEVIMLASLRYRENIVPFLRIQGFAVTVPFEHLKIGEQLQQLKKSLGE